MNRRKVSRVLEQRYASLKTRHAEIEGHIREEMMRPMPDFLAIQALKRRRLRVKEHLETVTGVMRTVSRPVAPDAA